MGSLSRQIKNNYRAGGIRQVVSKVFWRLHQWLWSEATWLIYRIDPTVYRREATLPLRCRELGFDSLLGVNYYKAFTIPEIIRTRLDSGAQCNAFFIGSDLVNIAWTT